MVKELISPPQPTRRKRLKRRYRWGIALLLLIVAIATVIAGLAQFLRPAPQQVVIPAVTPSPAFVPKVGETDDTDDGVTVALGQIPSFQFQVGGYTVSGMTVDAPTGRPVSGVSVWISLPPALGQRTAPSLRSVSTVDGKFSFQHLASGTYNLAAARYYGQNGHVIYPEVVQASIVVPQKMPLVMRLTPQYAPGARHPARGVARNLVILDMSGIYADSWYSDPALQLEATNMRALMASGAYAANVMAPYGWHPPDQYGLLSGTYPSWRVYDPWPRAIPWGSPDGIDTTFWYNDDPLAMNFGQESLFDVAQGYGMGTAALGGQRYMLSDVSTRGVQTAQIGLVFDSAAWLTAAEHLIENMANNPNGFVFYSELDPPLGPAGAAGAIPDAAGGAYARAMQADDELLGLLQSWLVNQGLLKNTVIMVTASEAQVNETVFDNYYGMGSDGLGTSLHVPLVIDGPGVAAGTVDQRDVSSFAVAATATRALCLPAPANAGVPALTSLFNNRCT